MLTIEDWKNLLGLVVRLRGFTGPDELMLAQLQVKIAQQIEAMLTPPPKITVPTVDPPPAA